MGIGKDFNQFIINYQLLMKAIDRLFLINIGNGQGVVCRLTVVYGAWMRVQG